MIRFGLAVVILRTFVMDSVDTTRIDIVIWESKGENSTQETYNFPDTMLVRVNQHGSTHPPRW